MEELSKYNKKVKKELNKKKKKKTEQAAEPEVPSETVAPERKKKKLQLF